MHLKYGLLFLSVLLLLCAPYVNISAAEAASDGYIFKLKESAVDSAGACEPGRAESPGKNIQSISPEDGLYAAKSMEDILSFSDRDGIAYIEPDYTAELYDADNSDLTEGITDDPCAASQWYLDAIRIAPLWQLGMEGQDLDASTDMSQNNSETEDPIVLAVIDSGMTAGLEDIDYSKILTGKNILDNSDDVTDDVFHGTFVTGILSSVKNNQNGIAGLLGDTYILPIKSFSGKTTAYSNIIKSILYAAEQKQLYNTTKGAEGVNVCVINLSLGGTEPSQALKEACQSAMELGIIMVSASGNNGSEAASYPAQYTMGVGSVGKTFAPSSFSQYLSEDESEGYLNKVWICAPGEAIVSYGNAADADGSYLLTKNGTSFSCPIVSALAAILKGCNNHLNQEAFMELTKNSAAFIDGGYGAFGAQDRKCGYGLVDFEQAFLLLSSDQTVTHIYTDAGGCAPGCETDGYTLETCAVCGASRTSTALALGHSWQTVVVQPDCTADGYQKKVCTRCQSETDVSVLPAHGHSYRTTVVSPTYVSEGFTLHTCTVCRTSYQDGYTSRLTLSRPTIRTIQNKTDGLTISWEKVTGASGYYVYRKNGSSWKTAATVFSSSWTDTSVKNGSACVYRVRAFAADNLSGYSSARKTYRLSPVKIQKIRKKDSRSLTLSFTGNAKATGCKIQYAANKSFSNAKSIDIKTNKTSGKTLQKTIRKLTAGKKYYIRIAAYKKSGGVRYYSSWTTRSVRL